MLRRSISLLLLSFALVACASPGTSTPSPSTPPSADPSPSAAASTSIELHRVAGDLGCDTIGIDYTSLTFHIDPAAADQVTALTNKGVALKTYWANGFQPGSDAERVIRDASGQVVVRDGDPLLVPAAAYPRLAGHFVCLSPDAIYVLDADPA